MRAGAMLLTIWSGLNFTMAVRPPQLTHVEPQMIFGSMRLFVFFGGLAYYCIALFCVLALGVIWRGLVRGAPGAWTALCATTFGVEAFSLEIRAQLGHPNFAASLVSTALLAAGLALTRGSEAKK